MTGYTADTRRLAHAPPGERDSFPTQLTAKSLLSSFLLELEEEHSSSCFAVNTGIAPMIRWQAREQYRLTQVPNDLAIIEHYREEPPAAGGGDASRPTTMMTTRVPTVGGAK